MASARSGTFRPTAGKAKAGMIRTFRLAGKTVTKSGAFLDRIDTFDADYFGIPAREAARMDPQQRLFLEVAIEALDDAGLSRRMLAGSRTGVFVASYHNDYAQLQYNDPDAIDLRTLTGTLHSVLANRLSYFLDLRGPSISIDTACSASLVAVHLACQSLRLGESSIAITGGVSLMIAPELLVSMSKVGFMAPDGRCKTFDELADGFGRGEGCSVVVLKRLSDAIADADRILAVIRGSAVNQDGHSTLLTAPSGPAQQALIREALACAQLSPDRIGFVETHGTGTALGDPIEVEAIAATIGQPLPGSGRCLLGSVKANLGHLEAAAGATGLVKAVLSLQHEAVPGQVNYHRPEPAYRADGHSAGCADDPYAVAGGTGHALRGGQLLRCWRHQRPRRHRGSSQASRCSARGTIVGSRRLLASAALGEKRGRVAGPSAGMGGLSRRDLGADCRSVPHRIAAADPS